MYVQTIRRFKLRNPTTHNEFSVLNYEQQLRGQGYRLIIGIDEAGRGPLAGPVVAAAVSLQDYSFQSKITDSKKMTLLQRERAFEEITQKAQVGIGIINETVIDRVNILQATFLAMSRAVEHLIYRLPKAQRDALDLTPTTYMLVDGNRFKTYLPFRCETVVKGDASVLSIACASVVAKVTRDRILSIYDQIYPQYGFKKHKGYPTAQHKEAIQKHGLSFIHRRSFSCV